MEECTGSPVVSIPVRQVKFHWPPQSDCFSKATMSGTSAPARSADSKARRAAIPDGPAPMTAIRCVLFMHTSLHGRGRAVPSDPDAERSPP